MKKLLCKVVSTAVAVSLVAGMCPITMDAATTNKKASTLQELVKENRKKATNQKSYVEGQVLVLTNQGTNGKTLNALKQETVSMGATVEDTLTIDAGNGKGGFQVSLIKSDKYTTEELMDIYEKSKNVRLVQPNYKYQKMTTGYDECLWALDNQGQNAGTVGMDINSDSEKVKMAAGEESKEKVIAVVDTGIDYKHEKLSSSMWTNPYPAYLEGEHGYDFVNYDADPMDDFGHGTHCAGIIQSVMNGENIKIMALKFLDAEGYGDTYGALGAYNYIYDAQRLGVNVVAINNSWGGGEDIDGMLEAMINLVGENGAISVCAAGNESTNLEEYEVFPASIDSPYVVSVAAANEKGELAGFSNYGNSQVDIAAPGADILSTVSYINFNPAVYGEDENGKKELCSTYEDFSGTLVTPDVPEKMVYSNVKEEDICYAIDGDFEPEKQSVTLNKEDYFGEKTEGAASLQWTIKDAEAGEQYIIYLPYTQEVSDTPVYENFMLKTSAPKLTENDDMEDMAFLVVGDTEIPESGLISELSLNMYEMLVLDGENNCWDQFSLQKETKVKKATDRALFIGVVAGKDGDYTVKLDDFAISESNVEEEKLGKTAFYNGTSMATPYAAGTVAVLANAYPEDNTLERVARLKGSVTKTEGLKDKVVSDGMLDLNVADAPLACYEKIGLNENGQLEILGNFFDTEAKVTINGEPVKIAEQKKESILVDGNYYNKNLQVHVECGGSNYDKELYFANGICPEPISMYDLIVSDSTMVSDGGVTYCVDATGSVYMFNEYSFENPYMAEIVPLCYGMDVTAIFGTTDGFADIDEDVAIVNSDLYAVAIKESGYSREAALTKLNTETMMWEKVSDLPDAYKDIENLNSFYAYTRVTLASYNGELYLLGGYDETNGKVVNNVYVYNTKTGTWREGVSMPEGRAESKSLQVNDKLVVTLGGNGSEEVPKNLIFDGKEWTISKAEIKIVDEDKLTYENSEKQTFSYYVGEIGLVKGGIMYANCKADGLGDTFTYNLAEDSYNATGYSVSEIGATKELCGTSMGNKFYILTGVEDSAIFDEFYDPSMQSSLIYALDIEDARYNVYEEAYAEGGMIYGVGSYLPGTDVALTAQPEENYYLKSFTVDGKQIPVEKIGATTTISKISSDVKVKAEFGAYVSQLVLDTEKIELTAGKSQKLNVQVLPENAENKSLTFESDNKNVVTVDANGKITANKKAAGKSAVVTVYANDRKTVVAKCTVTVKKATVKVKKIKLSTKKNVKKIKAGKSLVVSAKVTPTNASNKKVTWSTSNKKYATVKNGKVTAKKAGIGKTVTITAKAKDGSNTKASIKLKIVK